VRGALKESLRAWPRSIPYLKPHKGKVALSLLLMLLGAGVALLEPWPLALLVDSVLGDEPMPGPMENIIPEGVAPRVAAVMVLMLLVTLAMSSLGVLNDYVTTKIDMKMVLDFRSDLFQHVQRLSFDYHDERRTGEFMGRINGQASSVGAVTVSALPLFEAALTLVGMFVVAFTVNRPVALLSLSVVPFIYYTTGYYGSRIGPEVRKVKGMEIRSLHIVHEAVQMIRVIVAFNREKEEYEKFRKQGEEAVDARIKVTVKQTLFNGVVGLITASGTAAVLGLGAYQVRQGNLSVGQLLVLLSYIRAVYTPLETISNTMNSIQEQLIGFEMALELLETEPDVVEKPDAIELASVQGAVELDDVSFSYEGRDHTLRGISFRAAPGDAIAIVGPTGAGKSTLMSLLPRFYDPSGGRILIDGVDVRDATLSSLRRQISLVMQEPLLFSGTIEDNIRYGRPEATKEEVVAAAKAANAHDFIMKLPGKYRAKLGERGAKLSGGERQRISVARAFLKDAPILILDEPTSSIDSRTEAVILEALGKLMEGRTTFMVAHRLSTIQNATQILVINDGELIERGTHAELLDAGGLYRLLHDAQHGRNVGFFTPALAEHQATAASAANGAARKGTSNGHGATADADAADPPRPPAEDPAFAAVIPALVAPPAAKASRPRRSVDP
jgi:ATP-binding cassette subfamily B protein